jgi:hypothetical protein
MVLYCTFLTSSQPPTWHLGQLVYKLTHSPSSQFGISVDLLANGKIWRMGRHRYIEAKQSKLTGKRNMAAKQMKSMDL